VYTSPGTYVVTLTGGPGGGKTTLLEELCRDQTWSERLAVLPEAISLMRPLGVSPDERLFQQVMVTLQMALEDGLSRTFGSDDSRTMVCHRGSLDPLAYWLDRGWSEEEFFTLTQTTREDHYRRYQAVVHLVTAADGAEDYYASWPDAHRHEQVKDAIRIDRLLKRVWQGHPRYFRIDNVGRDWPAKSKVARYYLARMAANVEYLDELR
jgi:hypothetical protein